MGLRLRSRAGRASAKRRSVRWTRSTRLPPGSLDRGEDNWDELADALERAESAEWYEAVRGSDSMIGFLTGTSMPMWAVRLYAWWQLRGDVPFVDRLYDPVPTMEALDVPSLWIFGGEDSSMPTQWSIDELERLRSAGKPIEIEVFPDGEHGILSFEDVDGERRLRGYVPGYLEMQVDWILRQSAPAECRAGPRGGRRCGSRHGGVSPSGRRAPEVARRAAEELVEGARELTATLEADPPGDRRHRQKLLATQQRRRASQAHLAPPSAWACDRRPPGSARRRPSGSCPLRRPGIPGCGFSRGGREPCRARWRSGDPPGRRARAVGPRPGVRGAAGPSTRHWFIRAAVIAELAGSSQACSSRRPSKTRRIFPEPAKSRTMKSRRLSKRPSSSP